MIITPAERRIIIQESIRHDRDLHQLALLRKRHEEKMKYCLEEEEKTRERRKLALMTHEENNRANKLARAKEVEARQNFLKNLNVL